jgi:transposase-like protein
MTIKKKKQNKDSNAESKFDYESYEKAVVEGLRQGKGLLGEEGLLKPLIAKFVESALDAELSAHLEEESKEEGSLPNKRNGRQQKRLRTEAGELEVSYSRDRTSTFEPVTVGKRQHELAAGFDKQILELYAMSNSLADIRLHLEKMYGAQMSEARISNVINATWEVVDAWHKRPLPACYVVVFIDAVHVSVSRNGYYSKVAVYVVYGINVEGHREIIALYVGQGGESATEWGRCLQDLKNRGLEDIFHICSDGLAGLKDIMAEAFPLSSIQRCVVHKMRNCMRLVDDKDSRAVVRQLKEVYTAVNEAQARQRLEDFAAKWEGKYDCIVQLWEKDWDELMACMNLGVELRKITYTTNAIENLNREIRRVTKTKGGWPSSKSLLIQLYLSLDRKAGSWNKKVRGWASIQRELVQTYGERYTKHLI